MALGCGATAVAPIARSWAQPAAGRWVCYAVKEFPDVEDAQHDARGITEGLNRVAAHVPSGATLALIPDSSMRGSDASVACIKY
jgi:hypothetical protein